MSPMRLVTVPAVPGEASGVVSKKFIFSCITIGCHMTGTTIEPFLVKYLVFRFLDV